MTRVEAVVVSHNSASHIETCVQHLLAGGVASVRVVDNGSTDQSVVLARGAGGLVSQSAANLGFGRGVNLAMAHVTSELCLLANPDCIIDSGCLERLSAALEDDPRLAAVVPAMRYPDGSFGVAGGVWPTVLKEWLAFCRIDSAVPSGLRSWLSRQHWLLLARRFEGYLDPRPRKGLSLVDWISGWCMLVRVDAFQLVGGFDDDFFLYFEDVDLCARWRHAGLRVGVVGDVEARHDESASTSLVGKSSLYAAGMRTYFEKHGSAYARATSRVLARIMGA